MEGLTEGRRIEIFLALVVGPDSEVGVLESNNDTAEQFGITTRQSRRSEQEGPDAEWPPLA